MQQIKSAAILLLIITIITGCLYPLLITVIAQLCFPWQANGSLIYQNQQIIGSKLIGQNFQSTQYFWGRVSRTNNFPYNATDSEGSNLGPSNPKLLELIQQRIDQLNQYNTIKTTLVPIDLVTASASGLDPEISPLAAIYQAPRIANARHIPEQQVHGLIYKHITPRTFALLGEPRVNVLELNLALDNELPNATPQS